MNPPSQKDSPKENKKRRRLRLNRDCVECTDRHQRCDRKKPCTPCFQRGVSHRCRWEKEPNARPTPSRPPSHLGSDSDEKAELKKQVASLERQLDLLLQVASPEQRLMLQASHTGWDTESSVSDLDRFSTASRYSPTPSSVGSTYPLHTDETPTTRRMSGTIYSNLPYASEHPDNLFGQGSSMDYLHAPNGGWQAGGIVCPSIGSDHALVGSDWSQQSAPSIEELLSFIPPKDEIQSRSNTFFSKNWFGIPRGYFDAGVEHMFSCHQSGRNVDPNLLALLFAILGYASSVDTRLQPTGFEQSDRYFSFSNFALLIASVGESTYCSEYQTTNTSTFDKHQALLGCFCVPILCDHYVKRGRFEAAWALIDRWIQIAQAILHREDDPHGRIALWNLVAFDKIYCVALDKPSSNSCSLSTDSALEALEEDKYRLALYSLSNIASDVSEKCLGSTLQTIEDLDKRLELWKKAYLVDLGLTPSQTPQFHDESYTLCTWYWFIRMKVHLEHAIYEPKAPDDNLSRASRSVSRAHSQHLCITCCKELIQLHCNTSENAVQISPSSLWPSDQYASAQYKPSNGGVLGIFTWLKVTEALILIHDCPILGDGTNQTIIYGDTWSLLKRAYDLNVFRNCLTCEKQLKRGVSIHELSRRGASILEDFFRRTADWSMSPGAEQLDDQSGHWTSYAVSPPMDPLYSSPSITGSSSPEQKLEHLQMSPIISTLDFGADYSDVASGNYWYVDESTTSTLSLDANPVYSSRDLGFPSSSRDLDRFPPHISDAMSKTRTSATVQSSSQGGCSSLASTSNAEAPGSDMFVKLPCSYRNHPSSGLPSQSIYPNSNPKTTPIVKMARPVKTVSGSSTLLNTGYEDLVTDSDNETVTVPGTCIQANFLSDSDGGPESPFPQISQKVTHHTSLLSPVQVASIPGPTVGVEGDDKNVTQSRSRWARIPKANNQSTPELSHPSGDDHDGASPEVESTRLDTLQLSVTGSNVTSVPDKNLVTMSGEISEIVSVGNPNINASSKAISWSQQSTDTTEMFAIRHLSNGRVAEGSNVLQKATPVDSSELTFQALREASLELLRLLADNQTPGIGFPPGKPTVYRRKRCPRGEISPVWHLLLPRDWGECNRNLKSGRRVDTIWFLHHHDWGSSVRWATYRRIRRLSKRWSDDFYDWINSLASSWSSSPPGAFQNSSDFGIYGSTFVACEDYHMTTNNYNYPLGPGNGGVSPEELLRQIQIERRMLELERRMMQVERSILNIERSMFNIEQKLDRLQSRPPPEPDPPPDPHTYYSRDPHRSSSYSSPYTHHPPPDFYANHARSHYGSSSYSTPSTHNPLSNLYADYDRSHSMNSSDRIPHQYYPPHGSDTYHARHPTNFSHGARRRYHPYSPPNRRYTSPVHSDFHSGLSIFDTSTQNSNNNGCTDYRAT